MNSGTVDAHFLDYEAAKAYQEQHGLGIGVGAFLLAEEAVEPEPFVEAAKVVGTGRSSWVGDPARAAGCGAQAGSATSTTASRSMPGRPR